jgi:alpha-galactosidase/6-phospho-beta-glucosidase family protein
MNIAFIGGGSLRILPIVRSLLEQQRILNGGSIRLIDLKLDRAQAVGRMIMRCPEFKNSNCRVTWTDQLGTGLDGADILYVTMEILREPSNTLAARLSVEKGFLVSDQLSINGAFHAMRGGGMILSFARAMEKYCPHAMMLIFANPVSVYSGLVNLYTKIKALGICAGFHNHKWDIPRIMGSNTHDDSISVISAGVNHLSFILRGSIGGRDLYSVMDEYALDPSWSPPVLTPPLAPRTTEALWMLVRMYRRFRELIFSTEGDGLGHLFCNSIKKWDAEYVDSMKGLSAKEIGAVKNAEIEHKFADFAKEAAHNDDRVWAVPYKQNQLFGINRHDIINPVAEALMGGPKLRIAASAPNNGAVKGFTDRSILEYTMDVGKDGFSPVENLYVPAPFHGLISSLSEFQTLQADALASGDPKLFADALEAYPVGRENKNRAEYLSEMFNIYTDIPESIRKAVDYIKW